MWRVKIDLAYRVAYLLDDQGVTQLSESGVSRSTIQAALARWGYALVSGDEWECADILNAIDAVERVVEPVGS